MIGIIGAMQIEIDGLVKSIEVTGEKESGGYRFIEGRYADKQVVVCQCGIGKVASSVATALMIMLYPSISLVVNIGVAGGIYPSIRQGDVVVSKATVQHDWLGLSVKPGQVDGYGEVLLSACPDALDVMDGVLNKLNVKHFLANIASGDQFINDKDKAKWIFETFDAYACDMESAAINHACDLMNKRFLAVRAISDNGDGSAELDFYAFMEIAAKRSIEAMLEFIEAWN